MRRATASNQVVLDLEGVATTAGKPRSPGMPSPCLLAMILLGAVPVLAQKCRQTGLTPIDFSSITNPAVSMEWTDGTQATQRGSTIPAGWTGLNETGGELRWRRVGSVETEEGVTEFDLRVTVAPEPSYYADNIHIEYSPTHTIPPASFSEAGYACLGFSLQPSYCPSGAELDATASCADGTRVHMRCAVSCLDYVTHTGHYGTALPPRCASLLFTTWSSHDQDPHVQSDRI